MVINMKKRNLTLLAALTILTSCNHLYTTKEIKHLSDINNYIEYNVNYSHTTSIQENISSNTDSGINVTFNSHAELNLFMTTKVDETATLSSYKIQFFTPKNNTILLRENDFFTEIKENDPITIKVSNYKSINLTFRYLLSLKTSTKVYLDETKSIENIKAYLKENESPFFK